MISGSSERLIKKVVFKRLPRVILILTTSFILLGEVEKHACVMTT